MQCIEVCCFIIFPGDYHLESPLKESTSWWMNFKLFPQEYNDLADCLAENTFLLKVAYLCDIFAKLNKLNISMQCKGVIKIYLTFQIKYSVH